MDGNHARSVLGLPEYTSIEQINRAFRGAVLVAHPDRGGDATAFRTLVDARNTLLASAPQPTMAVANPFADLLRSRPSSTVSVLDIDRPRPVRSTAPPTPTSSDFDTLLAAALAA